MTLLSINSGVYNVSVFGPRILAAFSGREFPLSKRDDFLSRLDLVPTKVRFVNQVHGNHIVTLEDPNKETAALQADGLVTSQTGIGLGIRTADCMPVFFSNQDQTLAGIAHAGWKSLRQGILEGMVQKIRQDYGGLPETLRVFIGPSIRSCCYEVGEEFLEYFPGTCQKIPGAKPRMDLIREAFRRLGEAGLKPNQISDSGICTVCQNHQFFSARKEKTENRIFSVIQIKSR